MEETPLAKTVSENLIALRKSKKLTQQELAEQIGYSDKSISKWELGNAIPSVEILKSLADFYGVTVDYIVSEHSKRERIETSNKDAKKRWNQIVIMAMVVCCVFFTAGCIHVNGVIQHTEPNLWVAYVWAVPVSALGIAILSRFFYGKSLAGVISISVFLWSLITAFALTFYYYMDESIWFIYLVCIPVQVAIVLFHILK